MGGRVRVVGASDIDEVRFFLEQNQLENIFFLSRLELAGARVSSLGHPIFGFWRGRELVSVCHFGYNLVVAGDDDEAIARFADRIGPYRNTSSIMGNSMVVSKLYQQLVNRWGMSWARQREIRAHQPLLAISGDPSITPDQRIARAKANDFEAYLRASISMYSEEVGVSPIIGDGTSYRNYVRWLMVCGRAFGAKQGEKFWYKSDIGVVYRNNCQIQGVWVHPDFRGQGLAAPAMAQVVKLARLDFPVISLYVNDYNTRARKMYQRVGFQQVGELATVLY